MRALLKRCWRLRADRAAELESDAAHAGAQEVATLNVLITLTGGIFGQASEDEWLTAAA